MREIGSVALESELQVGDVILSQSRNTIYTIVGELPGIPGDGVSKILLIHSSRPGTVFKHEVPMRRCENYSYVTDGTYIVLGTVQNPAG